VSFNINPGFDRPTAVVDRPNDKALGFAFEYAMARPYPCFMRLEFVGDTPPLTIEYYVATPESGKRIARRIAIAQPLKVPRSRKGGIRFDARPARSAWVDVSGQIIVPAPVYAVNVSAGA
jgi:hypothetical protein